jgi:hypothetical protein
MIVARPKCHVGMNVLAVEVKGDGSGAPLRLVQGMRLKTPYPLRRAPTSPMQ